MEARVTVRFEEGLTKPQIREGLHNAAAVLYSDEVGLLDDRDISIFTNDGSKAGILYIRMA